MNKRTIRVGYLCTNTITIGRSYYTSNGFFQERKENMRCDGLKTDCSNLKFTLQDFEQLNLNQKIKNVLLRHTEKKQEPQ